MERFKELYPQDSSQYVELFKKALQIALKAKDPKEKSKSKIEDSLHTYEVKKRPYISIPVRRELLRLAQGGSSEPSNLTVLCAAHNAFRAVEEYGVQKMRPFLRGLK